jgi:hypothetical protein
VESKFLFYQAASQLPDGLSLADYEYRFYADNAGKEILSVEIDQLAGGDVIAYDSGDQKWKNSDTSSLVGPAGPEGKSAYEVAVDDGFVGTETQWLASLEGPQGIQGIQGIKGDKGDKGDQGDPGIQGIQGVPGEKGDKGDKGDQGDQGIQGIQGIQGVKGDTGDKGDKGDKGDQGDSGVVAATAPLAYDAPTQTVSLGAVTWGQLAGI